MKKLKDLLLGHSHFLVLAIAILGSAISVSGNDGQDAFVGTIEKIDSKAKIVYVKSKDGVVKAFKWTSRSVTHGIKSAAVWTGHEANVGAHVVVRAAKAAGEDTIKGLHWFGHGTVMVTEATVDFIEKNGKKIAVTTADGVKNVYNVSTHAVVHGANEVGHGAKTVGKYVGKKGTAAVQILEKDGKKFVHFIKHTF